MGGIRGNYCSACGRHLMYCQCSESCSASERQGGAAAPVAEGVALPPLPPIDEHWMTNDHTYTAEQVRQAQREAIAPYAERIRQLERELATFKGEHATQLATKSIEEDARFQCLLYHYVVARQKLADGRISEKEATDAFRELIARIDGRTAGPAVPECTQPMLEAAMKAAVAAKLVPKFSGEDDYLRHWNGMRASINAALAAAPKPQEDA